MAKIALKATAAARNLRCPKCGNTADFSVNAILVWFDISDGYVLLDTDTVVWGDEDDITCSACGENACVNEFRTDKQEEAA